MVFPEGTSAFFNPATSQLIVSQTAKGMSLVEAFVDSIKIKVQQQIHITTKFLEVEQTNGKELGFDWLVGPFNVGSSERVFGAGGVNGNSPQAIQGTDFVFRPPGDALSTTPTGQNPISKGLRFGSEAIAPDSIDGLLTSGIASSAATSVSTGIFALAGVFTDPEFQVVIRALDQKKGVDLMTAPSVTTRSGQRAKIEIIREFIYPTEFEPPQIPQQIGAVGGGGLAPGAGGNVNIPITPTTPTAFDVRNVGVTMEVDPVIGNDGYTIDLNLAPEVVEFEGFINYGSPIQVPGTDALGNPITTTLSTNRIDQPIFSTRRVSTAVTIWDGQTVAIGGLDPRGCPDSGRQSSVLG